jgi:hypothetical protein
MNPHWRCPSFAARQLPHAKSAVDGPACLEKAPPTDVDGDGVVDGNDWKIVLQAIGERVTPHGSNLT